MRTLITLILLFALVALPARARAGQAHLVSARDSGSIFRLEDKNDDGDALDVGENLLWGEGFTIIIELEISGGAVYAVEEGLVDGANQVVRLTDTNGDGDALDAGERNIWSDGLFNPRGIARDPAGAFLVTDISQNNVHRLFDLNNDGDALDIGENTLYADGILGSFTAEFVNDQLLVTAFISDTIHRLVDLNGDDDALDVGENLSITPPTIDGPVGLLEDGADGFYFGSDTGDTVYHVHDRTGDGDYFDVAEVLSYADYVFGGIDKPMDMAAMTTGGFLLANYNYGQILHVYDRNGDGDALDVGDVHVFADGLLGPVDIVRLPTSGFSANFDGDGDVDFADLVIWQGAFGVNALADADGDGDSDGRDFLAWQRQYTGSLPLTASSTFVPEPDALVLLLGGLLAGVRRRGISGNKY